MDISKVKAPQNRLSRDVIGLRLSDTAVVQQSDVSRPYNARALRGAALLWGICSLHHVLDYHLQGMALAATENASAREKHPRKA